MVNTRLRLTIGLAAVAGLAACGGKSAEARASEDLRRDLQLANGSAIELLPNAARTQVVSAVEQTGTAEPAPAPTKARTTVNRPKPRRVAPKATVRPRSPAPRASQPAPRSSSSPTFDANVISPPPPGGYKTVDEVIRNAPFPIKP